MRTHRFSMSAVLFAAAAMAVMTGCEYDVAQPQWEKDFEAPPTPKITQIEPAQAATPGVNTITIRGENFTAPPGINDVYFGTVRAEVVAASATSITVRRPNLATDSCTVNVIAHGALVGAKFGPYRIDPVLERNDSFRDNVELRTVAVDNAENLYVVRANAQINPTFWIIDKVTPDGQKAIVDTASRAPTDARIGPGGQLYLLSSNREIERFNLVTGVRTRWHRLSLNRQLRFGDFDANNFFYTGGSRTDLFVITPDSTSRAMGFYASEEILAVRVYNGYVYVAARVPVTGTAPPNPASIWRHQILDAIGNLGSRELVLDLASGEFASRTVRALTFSADGTIYIATDSPNPLLIVDPITRGVDYLYKGILPSNCKQFYWGTGTSLYMIRGDTSLGEEWTVFRVDAGKPGAPYYGL
jgi:hypothetical protein